ncbi:MAG: 4'-phosphopantetheinyl transferase superfamily protein [Ruminococcus sp.]|nr:4'-phosphopantetheinyl transferase superfamily protein [Ruminococcus sp.]
MIYRIQNISALTQEEYLEGYKQMSPERQAKADRYTRTDDKRRCVFAHSLLQEMLRDTSQSLPVAIVTDPKGKPRALHSSVQFSISHSGNYVACVTDSSPVGIDIQTIGNVSPSTIRHTCTEQELLFVWGNNRNEITSPDIILRFLQVWTAKEAYLKYTGQGITAGLRSIAVADESGILRTLPTGQKLITIIEDDYVAAVVCEQ